MSKQRHGCSSRKPHRLSGQHGPGVAGPTIASLGHPGSASQDDDSDDMDFSAPRKGRLSAPQRQAQLSQLTDRTRLGRLKDTIHSSQRVHKNRGPVPCSSLPQVAFFFYLDACVGRVLTPHDHITNVQKRLGNKLWEGDGQCRCCGSFLDPQLESAETCSTAEATRGHYACVHAVVCGMKLADPGITTEPRGFTATG